MARIDHILVRGVTATKAWVLTTTSDHRPISGRGPRLTVGDAVAVGVADGLGAVPGELAPASATSQRHPTQPGRRSGPTEALPRQEAPTPRPPPPPPPPPTGSDSSGCDCGPPSHHIGAFRRRCALQPAGADSCDGLEIRVRLTNIGVRSGPAVRAPIFLRSKYPDQEDFEMTIRSSGADLSTLAQQYAEDGFVLVKGLLSKEETTYYRQRSHDLLASLNRTDDPTWKSAMGLPRRRHPAPASARRTVLRRRVLPAAGGPAIHRRGRRGDGGRRTSSCTTPSCS